MSQASCVVPATTTDDGDETIACPYCGKKATDLWDLNMESGEQRKIECDHCTQTFRLTAQRFTTYEATPMASPNGECCAENASCSARAVPMGSAGVDHASATG